MAAAPEIVTKKTTEVRYVVMDFAAELEDVDTIVGTPTIAFSPATGAPTASSIGTSGQTVTCKLTSGTAGVYTVVVTIVTSAGETLVGEGRLDVV